jgi:hypothetical protein
LNFFSHLAIASSFTDDPDVALGAMLPDLASLLGTKPPRSIDVRVRLGYELHLATDRVFHDLDLFRAACRTESAELRSLGIERGSAMAAAHIGLEFFLDDALAEDEISRLLYSAVLLRATPTHLSGILEWKTSDFATAFEALRQRLTALAPMLNHSGTRLSPAERICRTLSRRPRLAVRADARGILDSWARQASSRYAATWPGVVNSVTVGLERARWNNQRESFRSLRFRRAQASEV